MKAIEQNANLIPTAKVKHYSSQPSQGKFLGDMMRKDLVQLGRIAPLVRTESFDNHKRHSETKYIIGIPSKDESDMFVVCVKYDVNSGEPRSWSGHFMTSQLPQAVSREVVEACAARHNKDYSFASASRDYTFEIPSVQKERPEPLINVLKDAVESDENATLKTTIQLVSTVTIKTSMGDINVKYKHSVEAKNEKSNNFDGYEGSIDGKKISTKLAEQVWHFLSDGLYRRKMKGNPEFAKSLDAIKDAFKNKERE